MSDAFSTSSAAGPEGIAHETHQLLLTAIHEKRLIRFVFGGKERVAEPHDYGIHNASVRLLTYQIAGASGGALPGWRWFEVARMSEIALLEKTFAGGRPGSGKHHRWDTLFARVGQP